MSALADIGDAIVSRINDAAIAIPAPLTSGFIVATRANLAVFDLAVAGDSVMCTVVPAGIDIEAASRGKRFHDYAFDIGLQRRIDTLKTVDADAMHEIVEAIVDLFGPALTLAGAAWRETAVEPNALPETLERLRVLTTVITVTFRAQR